MPARNSKNRLRIDDAAECIWRDGEKIGIPPKAFLVLRQLMGRPGQLVTKSHLLETVWPNTFVTETVLNNAVRQLRQALGDDPKQPSFIETVHRRGFRWIGTVTINTASTSLPTRAPPEISSAEPAPTNFVGRTDSLAELARCYARAAGGQRQMVLISGEPGIGKTALVDEFVKRLAGQVLVAHGQCIESYGAGEFHLPVREGMERLLRDGGEEMHAIFRKHAPSWLLSLPELASPAELELLRRSAVNATSGSVQRELERALEAASTRRPLVLVLEDLHWSHPATVSLLWSLATRREPAQLLIIGTYRSVDAIAHQHPITRLKRELTIKRQCVDLALEGLPRDEVAAFLDRLFPRHQLSSVFAARLCEQTTGNPLFLLNALADFERRGGLQEHGGVWRCTVDLDSLLASVPESTRELIAFRLDELPPSTRELLEAASIAGATFATQAVAAATERGCIDVEAELDRWHARLFSCSAATMSNGRTARAAVSTSFATHSIDRFSCAALRRRGVRCSTGASRSRWKKGTATARLKLRARSVSITSTGEISLGPSISLKFWSSKPPACVSPRARQSPCSRMPSRCSNEHRRVHLATSACSS